MSAPPDCWPRLSGRASSGTRPAKGRRGPSSPRQQGELELLVTGALWPLAGYPTRATTSRSHREMQPGRRHPCPVPLTLDVTAEVAEAAEAAGQMALRDPRGRAAGRGGRHRALGRRRGRRGRGPLRHHRRAPTPGSTGGSATTTPTGWAARSKGVERPPTGTSPTCGSRRPTRGRPSAPPPAGAAWAWPPRAAAPGRVRHLYAEMAMEGLLSEVTDPTAAADAARSEPGMLTGPPARARAHRSRPGPTARPDVLVPPGRRCWRTCPTSPVLAVIPCPPTASAAATRDCATGAAQPRRDRRLEAPGRSRPPAASPADGARPPELRRSAGPGRGPARLGSPIPEVEDVLRRRYPPLTSGA